LIAEQEIVSVFGKQKGASLPYASGSARYDNAFSHSKNIAAEKFLRQPFIKIIR
jgi:hypothetical protein